MRNNSKRSLPPVPKAYAPILIGVALLVSAYPISAQLPERFSNLQVLPPDIPRDSLIEVMRQFSFDLGVRCQYCHIGGDGISFEGVRFDSDDDPDKVKARFMLRMVDQLNDEILPQLANRDDPPLEMGCKNCHRGQPRPETLRQRLRAVLDADGPDAMVAEYRTLRQSQGMAGTYDFGEWETNVLAERLAREDRVEHAIRVYLLNAEFHPESSSIPFSLGQLYERAGDNQAAIAAYRRVLELRPEHTGAIERLAALTSG